MGAQLFPFPTFAEVQRISDVYSSGIWMMYPYSEDGNWLPVPQQIFKNATSNSIYAYVTISNENSHEGLGLNILQAQLYNGPVGAANFGPVVGTILGGTSAGFLLLIAAGDILTITQTPHKVAMLIMHSVRSLSPTFTSTRAPKQRLTTPRNTDTLCVLPGAHTPSNDEPNGPTTNARMKNTQFWNAFKTYHMVE